MKNNIHFSRNQKKKLSNIEKFNVNNKVIKFSELNRIVN